MRRLLVHTFVLLLALALAGCSIASDLSDRLLHSGQISSPSATVAPTTQPISPQLEAPTPVPTTPVPEITPSDGPTSAAIQAVIQRANQAQQEAFAKNDPSIMKDTATADYYDQMVQTNMELATGGVSAIDLVKIEWGPVSLLDASTARATTFETWRTTFANGSTIESRDRNIYTLVQEQGVWKIQNDDHPDANPNHGAPLGSPL